jgi:hypothetical protein
LTQPMKKDVTRKEEEEKIQTKVKGRERGQGS